MQLSNTNLMNRDMKTGRRGFFFQYLLLFVMLIFSIYQYSVHRLYGFSVYPDEFGYWASAAQWLGYDWSDVASLGYYYSFGYSLILTPILWLCHDSIMAYRVAVFVNMCLQSASVGLLWGIFRRLYSLKDFEAKFGTDYASYSEPERERIRKKQLVFAVGVAAFYPAWTFYMQMTLTEALLAFLYVFICYQFVLLLEEAKIINVIYRILLLAIAFLYLHFVHMRTVGVVMAALFVLVLYLWQRPSYRKLLLLTAAILVIGIAAGMWMKELVVDNVYAAAAADNLAVNDYTGKIQSVMRLLTPQGMKQVLQSCAGKLYYLSMASFGLFCPVVLICAKRTIILLRGILGRKGETEKKDWFYMFLLLSMMGQFLVSAVFTSGAGRLDGIIYGRYNEYVLPVFMGIGILFLLNCKHPWKILICNIGISFVLFVVSLWTALHSESRVMRAVFATGLNYLSKSTDSYQVVSEFIKAYLFGIFLMIILTGSVYIGRHFRQNVCSMAIVLLMEILLTVCLCRKYTWVYNDSDYYDLKVYEYMETYWSENTDTPVWYLYGGGTNYIDLIQFAMRDKKIEILLEEDVFGGKEDLKKDVEVLEQVLPETGFLIADYKSPYLSELEEKYLKCVESNSFMLFLAE